jgi:hypothetical protein
MLQISATTQVARIIGISHQHPAEKSNLKNKNKFALAQLFSNSII